MAPKKASSSATVYLVVIGTSIDSVHASIESANAQSTKAKDKGKDNVRVEVQQLVGGTINIDPAPAVEEKKPVKSKAKAIKDEKEDDAPAPAPKANTATKKTKTPAEQRAVNAAKPTKAEDEDLPDNIKALLKGNGTQLDGLRIVVTGVPPSIGRKNAEKLVQLYGGNLTKSLSKNTSFVVVGNDAGPTKLEKIAELGITTWDEDDLMAKIESGSNGVKRSADDDDDEEEEEDEKPAATKPKKRKTTKS